MIQVDTLDSDLGTEDFGLEWDFEVLFEHREETQDLLRFVAKTTGRKLRLDLRLKSARLPSPRGHVRVNFGAVTQNVRDDGIDSGQIQGRVPLNDLLGRSPVVKNPYDGPRQIRVDPRTCVERALSRDRRRRKDSSDMLLENEKARPPATRREDRSSEPPRMADRSGPSRVQRLLRRGCAICDVIATRRTGPSIHPKSSPRRTRHRRPRARFP
jgi:hypothetical protein